MTENGAILSIPGATVLPERKGMERVLCKRYPFISSPRQ